MLFRKTIPGIYLILALMAAIILSPLPYSAIALILILLQVYYIYRPFSTSLNLTLTFATLFIMPLTLQPATGDLFSALLVIPAVPLLDTSLRENALNHDFQPARGRKPTIISGRLAIAIVIVLVTSFILANRTLTFTGALIAVYFIAISGYILYKIPKAPLQGSCTRIRIIAGDTSRIPVTIQSRARLTLHTLFTSPHPWIHLDSARLKLGTDETKLNIAITPPLSGPSKPQIQAMMTDPWGLTQITQYLEPVDMYVIPKARYAEWLAKKFLGQAALHISPTVMATPPSSAPIATRRGIEYLGSRPYHPGDSLKNMDWKRMCKLNKLVVKEYSEAQELATIIVVNLTVKDPEEADNLAYSMVMLALTLARVSAPAALVAYNHQEILLTTEVLEPREILKKALKLAQEIVQVEPVHRFLQPPDIRRLKSTMTHLEQAKTEPAQKLAAILRLENEAIQQGTKDHPAVIAITKVAEYVHPPATIAVVSGWNHDTEALLVTLERLERHGYNTIKVIDQHSPQLHRKH